MINKYFSRFLIFVRLVLAKAPWLGPPRGGRHGQLTAISMTQAINTLSVVWPSLSKARCCNWFGHTNDFAHRHKASPECCWNHAPLQNASLSHFARNQRPLLTDSLGPRVSDNSEDRIQYILQLNVLNTLSIISTGIFFWICPLDLNLQELVFEGLEGHVSINKISFLTKSKGCSQKTVFIFLSSHRNV